MLRRLIITECRLAVRSSRVRAIAGLTLVLSLFAGAAGVRSHQAQVEAYEQLTGFGRSGFEAQSAEHPHAIAHRGYVVSRPPPALGFIDGGLDRAQGRWLRLDAHRTRDMQGAKTADLVRAPGAGRFDLGLLIILALPAFIVALGYDRIAGERRRGTFAMLRASGLRAGPWALAKSLGLTVRWGLAIAVPVASVALAATLYLAPEQLPRLGLWLFIQALGLTAWAGIVLTISALSADPRAALTRCLAAWAVLALAVPPAASGVARVFAEPAPPAELASQLATWAESAHAQSEALRARAVEDVRRRHPEWNGRGEPPEVLDAVMLRLADQDVAKRMRALRAEVQAEQDKEAQIAASLCLFSPSGLALLAGAAVAGSDLAHAAHAAAHFEAYRQRLMAWINHWWAKNGTGGFEAFAKDRRLDDLSEAPRPQAPKSTMQLAFRGSQLPCALLIALIGLSMAGLVMVSRRQLGGAHS